MYRPIQWKHFSFINTHILDTFDKLLYKLISYMYEEKIDYFGVFFVLNSLVRRTMVSTTVAWPLNVTVSRLNVTRSPGTRSVTEWPYSLLVDMAFLGMRIESDTIEEYESLNVWKELTSSISVSVDHKMKIWSVSMFVATRISLSRKYMVRSIIIIFAYIAPNTYFIRSLY